MKFECFFSFLRDFSKLEGGELLEGDRSEVGPLVLGSGLTERGTADVLLLSPEAYVAHWAA